MAIGGSRLGAGAGWEAVDEYGVAAAAVGRLGRAGPGLDPDRPVDGGHRTVPAAAELPAAPAPGDLSVGGVIAIDAHGTAVPAVGESRTPGTTYGSLSNLVTALEAVVWDQAAGRFVLRTFHRADPDSAAFLANLGRALVTEVTLQVGRNSNLRCVSRVDISAEELFAAPGSPGPDLRQLRRRGRTGGGDLVRVHRRALAQGVECQPEPTAEQPAGDRPVQLSVLRQRTRAVAALAGRIIAGEYELAPVFGQAQYAATAAGLTATVSADIWGPSKNLLLYIRPTTIRMHANGYAVLTSRSNVQHVVHEFTAFYQTLLRA